jgi:hypothetical protein
MDLFEGFAFLCTFMVVEAISALICGLHKHRGSGTCTRGRETRGRAGLGCGAACRLKSCWVTGLASGAVGLCQVSGCRQIGQHDHGIHWHIAEGRGGKQRQAGRREAVVDMRGKGIKYIRSLSILATTIKRSA